jgi:hypothetical protein
VLSVQKEAFDSMTRNLERHAEGRPAHHVLLVGLARKLRSALRSLVPFGSVRKRNSGYGFSLSYAWTLDPF